MTNSAKNTARYDELSSSCQVVGKSQEDPETREVLIPRSVQVRFHWFRTEPNRAYANLNQTLALYVFYHRNNISKVKAATNGASSAWISMDQVLLF
jgi:hypothetical protein